MIQIFLFITFVISLPIFLIFLLFLSDVEEIKDKLICLIFCLIFSTISYKSFTTLVKTIIKEELKEERYEEWERSVDYYPTNDTTLVNIDSLIKNTKIFKY